MSMVFANRISVHTIDGISVSGPGEILGVVVTSSNALQVPCLFYDALSSTNEIFRITTSGADLGPMTMVRDIPFKVTTGLFVNPSASQTVSVFIRRGDAP